MIKKIILVICLFAFTRPAFGQDSSSLQFSVYGEIYYNFDFSRPANHTRPSFVYSHNRTEEVNINLGLIRASFEAKDARASLGIMAGTYSNANLETEPG